MLTLAGFFSRNGKDNQQMKHCPTLIIVTTVITFYSCNTCIQPGDPVPRVHEKHDAYFYIIKDSTNTNFYSSQTSCDSAGEYCPDSLRLYDANFNSIPINYSAAEYKFYPLPVYNEKIDYLAKSQAISKIFYVKLNYLDIDTIKIKYSLQYHKKCKYSQFRNEQAFYNEKEIIIDGNLTGIEFIK